MIDNSGVVKLADMGLARETTDIKTAQTEAGKAYGTPYYIAPEQIRGEIDIDGRADIYGLGCTLYHMVTGRVPYMADDPTEVMKKHLRDQLIPPDHINTSLSAGLSEVIEVMMAKKRDDRYSGVEELLVDLEAVHKGQAPLRAHKRFDLSALEELEEGEALEGEGSAGSAAAIARYQVAVVVLSAVAAVAIFVIILLALR